ncbi:hypothetical protein LXL04_013730 [Taraxacum kok-saghyz]
MFRALSVSCSVLSFDLALEMVMEAELVTSVVAAVATAVDRWRARRRMAEDEDDMPIEDILRRIWINNKRRCSVFIGDGKVVAAITLVRKEYRRRVKGKGVANEVQFNWLEAHSSFPLPEVSRGMVLGSNRVQSSEALLWKTRLLMMLLLPLRRRFEPGFVGCYGILPYRMSLPTTPNRRSKKSPIIIYVAYEPSHMKPQKECKALPHVKAFLNVIRNILEFDRLSFLAICKNEETNDIRKL